MKSEPIPFFLKLFQNVEEEIHFFREIKPLFMSKLIYYLKIYRLETRRPTGNRQLDKKLIKGELKDIQKTYKKYTVFFQYYKSGAAILIGVISCGKASRTFI